MIRHSTTTLTVSHDLPQRHHPGGRVIHDGAIPLAVESPSGRADLIVDGTRPLESLLPAMAAATGVLIEGVSAGWVCWEGQRRLDLRRSLDEQGVLAGSGLWLTPA